jgi:acetyl-CoA carboxylase biotin carboxyl carrier protein
MTIDFKELRELLAAIASTDITELTLKNEEFELTVSKSRGVSNGEMMMMPVPTSTNPQLVVSTHQETITVAANSSTTAIVDKKWVEIKSPMVGTFYRSPAPDEAAFASVGDRIRVGQTVCIIEAMKLMNEIEAEAAGQVMEVLVENGQPIEFGQILMYINPT